MVELHGLMMHVAQHELAMHMVLMLLLCLPELLRLNMEHVRTYTMR